MIDLDEEILKVYAYVVISSYRAKTVKALDEAAFDTPASIAKNAGIRLNFISNVLNELKEAGVAECLNEDARKGRLYRLTDLGKEVAKYIE